MSGGQILVLVWTALAMLATVAVVYAAVWGIERAFEAQLRHDFPAEGEL